MSGPYRSGPVRPLLCPAGEETSEVEILARIVREADLARLATEPFARNGHARTAADYVDLWRALPSRA